MNILPLNEIKETDEQQMNKKINTSNPPFTVQNPTVPSTTATTTNETAPKPKENKLSNNNESLKVLKKKLKKLRKRAYNAQKQFSSYSGIITQNDYNDYINLNEQLVSYITKSNDNNNDDNDRNDIKIPGSCLFININKGSTNQQTWKKCDGIDIRDLLLNILLFSNQEKTNKRKHDDITFKLLDKITIPKMPNWARIHNPAFIRALAVIEINIDTSLELYESNNDTTSYFMPSNTTNLPTVTALLKEGIHKRKATPITTKLFQGNIPQSISNILLYFDRIKPTVTHESKVEDILNNFSNSLFPLLHPLVLSEEQLRNDNFPICSKSNECIEIQNKIVNAQLLPSSFPIVSCSKFPFTVEESKHITKHLSQLPDDCKDDTNDLFIPTFKTYAGQERPKVYAIDCEMVLTNDSKHTLARVTVLQSTPTHENLHEYKIILDTYVKPNLPIIDYLTQYSGISSSTLENVTITLQQVQCLLLNIIHKEDILVGHSIENDLIVLGLSHLNIVDTAILFQSENNSRKYSLKHLSNVLLQKNIQNQKGHDSIEDASTSLILAIQRSILGSSYCIHDTKRINLFDIVSDMHHKTNHHCMITDQTKNIGKFACIGSDAWIKQHIKTNNSAHVLSCECITDTTKLKAISSYLKNKKPNASFVYSSINLNVTPQNHKQMLDYLDTFILQQISSIDYTIPILIAFQRLYGLAKSLTNQKTMRSESRNRNAVVGGLWDEGMERRRVEIVDCCRDCDVLFLGMAL